MNYATIKSVIAAMLIMAAGIAVGAPTCPSGQQSSGSITWEVSGDVLTIDGSGDMLDYPNAAPPSGAPWRDCSSTIKKIRINDGITKIGKMAFWSPVLYPYQIDTLYIGSGVSSIGYGALYANIAHIVAAAGSPYYKTVDGVLYTIRGDTLVRCPASKACSYNIEHGTQYIEDYAFALCTGLTAVTIPQSVTKIGANVNRGRCFEGCTNLTTLFNFSHVPQNINHTNPVFNQAAQQSGILYVPSDAVTDYQNAAGWQDWGCIAANQLIDNDAMYLDSIAKLNDSISIFKDSIVKMNDTITIFRDSIVKMNDTIAIFRDSIVKMNDTIGIFKDSIVKMNDTITIFKDSIVKMNDTITIFRDSIVKMNDTIGIFRDSMVRMNDTIAMLRLGLCQAADARWLDSIGWRNDTIAVLRNTINNARHAMQDTMNAMAQLRSDIADAQHAMQDTINAMALLRQQIADLQQQLNRCAQPRAALQALSVNGSSIPIDDTTFKFTLPCNENRAEISAKARNGGNAYFTYGDQHSDADTNTITMSMQIVNPMDSIITITAQEFLKPSQTYTLHVVRQAANIVHQLWDDVLLINKNLASNNGISINSATAVQWKKNGSIIPDATNHAYYLTPSEVRSDNEYSVRIFVDGREVESCPLMHAACLDAAAVAYPNPTRGMVTVALPKSGNIEIYSLQGALLLQIPAQEGETTMNLGILERGIYMLRAAGRTIKVVVEK
jgi:hypothetical protein